MKNGPINDRVLRCPEYGVSNFSRSTNRPYELISFIESINSSVVFEASRICKTYRYRTYSRGCKILAGSPHHPYNGMLGSHITETIGHCFF